LEAAVQLSRFVERLRNSVPLEAFVALLEDPLEEIDVEARPEAFNVPLA
jgi:CRISPR/Cas system CSM-associated protein Csm2 small subunit